MQKKHDKIKKAESTAKDPEQTEEKGTEGLSHPAMTDYPLGSPPNSPAGDTVQLKSTDNRSGETIEQKTKDTSLPDHLKAGMEKLSGYAMDDVKVHYNSSKPAQLQAEAYAKGTDIHLGPGQEKHLPHEAWHVVQQKQGRVDTTMQMKGQNINDDAGLETEADHMGAKAESMGKQESTDAKPGTPARASVQPSGATSTAPMQMRWMTGKTVEVYGDTYMYWELTDHESKSKAVPEEEAKRSDGWYVVRTRDGRDVCEPALEADLSDIEEAYAEKVGSIRTESRGEVKARAIDRRAEAVDLIVKHKATLGLVRMDPKAELLWAPPKSVPSIERKVLDKGLTAAAIKEFKDILRATAVYDTIDDLRAGFDHILSEFKKIIPHSGVEMREGGIVDETKKWYDKDTSHKGYRDKKIIYLVNLPNEDGRIIPVKAELQFQLRSQLPIKEGHFGDVDLRTKVPTVGERVSAQSIENHLKSVLASRYKAPRKTGGRWPKLDRYFKEIETLADAIKDSTGATTKAEAYLPIQHDVYAAYKEVQAKRVRGGSITDKDEEIEEQNGLWEEVYRILYEMEGVIPRERRVAAD